MNEDNLKKLAQILVKTKEENSSIKMQVEKERRDLVSSVGKNIVDALKPILSQLVAQSKITKDDIKSAISQIRVNTNIPDIIVPPISVPEPKVSVNMPPIKMPEMHMPDEMNIKGWVQLMGVDLQHPLPVQLRDKDGKPLNLLENLTTLISGGGGGGKHDYFTIKGFSQSAYADYLNSDNRLRVSVETGSVGLTDTELRASAVPISQVSGANWSVYVSGSSGSIAITSLNGDGTYRSTYPIEGNVGVTGSITSTGAYLLNGEGTYRGTLPIEGTVAVSGITNSVAVTLLDGEGVMKATWLVSDITNSVKTALVDSSGVQYSGSNPLPISDAGGSLTIDGTVSVSGSITSTVVTGTTVSDAIDDASAPVKQGGIARTANPTAVAGGDIVSASYDDTGRQLIRPLQVRDLIATAYVSLTNGTEATLLSASAGSFHDLIYVMGANNSDVAVTVDIRPVTAGNVIMTLQVPANGTAGIATPIPLPQSASDTGNNWTADMGDITGTVVYLTALFTREI